MATNPYATPLALAQDVLTIKNGGAAPTDDENIQLRQILFWMSTYVAQLFRQQVFESRGVSSRVDDRLWQPVTMTVTEVQQPSGPFQAMPKLSAKADMPADVLNWADKLLLKDVFWGSYQLAPLPIETVRQGSTGFGRFGQPQYGWAVSGKTMELSLPITDDVNKALTALAVVVPDYGTIIDNPEQENPWPSEWNESIRAQLLTNLGITAQQVPDQKNNGADLQSDKR